MPIVYKHGNWVEPPKRDPAPSPDAALWAGAKALCPACDCGFTVRASDTVVINTRIEWEKGQARRIKEGFMQCAECPAFVTFALVSV